MTIDSTNNAVADGGAVTTENNTLLTSNVQADPANNEATGSLGDVVTADDGKAKPDGDGSDASLDAVVYEFELPEEFVLAEENKTEFEAFARENKLSNESANKALGMAVKHVQKLQEEAAQQWRDEVEGWGKSIQADKELGGDKLQASISFAQKTIAKFGSPELVSFLNESGIGNHPELFRFCHRIGMQISEGGVITGDGVGESRKSTADVFYGNKT